MKNISFIALLFGLVLTSCGQSAKDLKGTTPLTANFWGDYQKLLDEVVTVNKFEVGSKIFTHNSVDYDKLRKSEELKALVTKQYKALANIQVPEERNARLAFLMNSYNFLTLKDLQDNVKITSMTQLGWKSKKFLMSSSKFSLDAIEHNLIRPLKDPRIHFAVNCASVGCPSLDNKVLEAEGLDKKLDELVINALKNPLHIKKVGSVVKTTKLFSWFKSDFTLKSKDGLEEFITQYSELSGDIKVKADLDYDWQLNNKENILKVLKESAKPHSLKVL